MNPTEMGGAPSCPVLALLGASSFVPFHLSGDVVNQYNPQRQHFTRIFRGKSSFVYSATMAFVPVHPIDFYQLTLYSSSDTSSLATHGECEL
jgi:hypothetical protein